MVPALGVLPADVEPRRRVPLPRPRDGERGSALKVSAFEQVAELAPDDVQQLDGQARADSSAGGDPLGVQPVEECSEVRVAGDRAVRHGGRVSIALDAQSPDCAVGEVRDDIADPPQRRARRPLPVIWRQRAHHHQEFLVQRRKQRARVDGAGGFDVRHERVDRVDQVDGFTGSGGALRALVPSCHRDCEAARPISTTAFTSSIRSASLVLKLTMHDRSRKRPSTMALLT